jgi:hypothetical protein
MHLCTEQMAVRIPYISDFVLLGGQQADKRLRAARRQPLTSYYCTEDDNFHPSASPPNILNLPYFKLNLIRSLPTFGFCLHSAEHTTLFSSTFRQYYRLNSL